MSTVGAGIGADLHTTAMLVSLTISRWTGAKQDRGASREVTQQHRAAEEMGTFRKRLIAKDALEQLAGIAARAGEDHRRYTLPWLDRQGTRILAASAYEEYSTVMRAHREAWGPAVEAFLSDYPRYQQEAQAQLGTLYNEKDYPPVETMRNRFSFGLNIFPLPSEDDFRVGLNAEAVRSVREQIAASTQEAVSVAVTDVAARIRDVVSHMVERLGAYSVTVEGRRGVFHDSLVQNIADLVDIIPILNITSDPRITALGERMRSDLLRFTAADLRNDQAARDATRAAAERIVADMESFV